MTQLTESEHRPIRVLSASVVNKIAAGEVIERPASVVKELLENAIDSSARRVEVVVENGGIDLIRICDDGCGIPKDELPLAVTSHATSKIIDDSDLFHVATFGFRGEALASIAEISQFTIRSRTRDSECGFELLVHGGRQQPVAPCGMAYGTIVEVRNLFFNTPVRRKFMRTAQTERAQVVEAFARIALANHHTHLTLSSGDKTLYDLPPVENWSSRIRDFFGNEIAEALIPVSSESDGVRVSGFVVNPAIDRANNRFQYLFLNGRYIRDRSLQHALGEAYRGLLMTNRFPIAFLKMEMSPEMVDVNVHPAKLEVRFQEGGKLYSQLLSTIRSKFLSTDLTAKANLTPSRAEVVQGHSTGSFSDDVQLPDCDSPFALRRPTPLNQGSLNFSPVAPRKDWTTSPPSELSSPFPIGPTPAFKPFPELLDRRPAHVHTAPAPSQQVAPSGQATSSTDHPPHRIPPHPVALQVHNTYLISETEEGMVVIDQHALHERIIYEQLRDKILNQRLETQRLLVPEPVTLAPAEAATVLEKAELLRALGIEVEPFGGDTVLVSAYPAMLANQNPAEMLRHIVELMMSEGHQLNQRDLIDHLLHSIACKAAIKAGDKLTAEEISDLLAHRDYCQDAHHCPHGRPTALVFSRAELDKRFKRI